MSGRMRRTQWYNLDISLDVHITSQQCESIDMPCGVLLQQYEMPWLFKRDKHKTNSSTDRTEVLLHYLNAIILN